jgi:hypothetical protein
VEIVFRVGSTAMVVERNTRNKGNTHHTPVVPRVQPCSSVPRRVASNPFMDGEARGHHTERCLQLDGSHHDRITQLVIH